MGRTDSEKNDKDKQLQFHEALAFLVETSNINNGIVSLDEIHQTFNGIIEDESMYQYIYDYLLENKITIQDYIQHNTKSKDNFQENDQQLEKLSKTVPFETEEEQKFVNMYLEETNSLAPLEDSRELELLKLLYDSIPENNTSHTVNQLIEGNLHLVLSVLDDYKNKGVTTGDLIQEGNLGLTEGVSTYFSDSSGTIDLSEFHDYLLQCISRAMSDAIHEQNISCRLGKHLADNANRMDKASVELSRDLGRTPTLPELAKYLSISEEEAERIMKMSLDALNADNAGSNEP
ncbi:MAG: hypothetical protein HFI34_08990 [Lachnospiraceae bacterium]|nr:hypothetical protein [Lachnospiraceae bacterium]